MIINDKFVFIHNPRTGGAFIKNLCKRSFSDSKFADLQDYHLPIASLEEQYRDRLKFGMIRNPWAWYVSLYHFQQPRGQWLRLCSPNNNFKEFVTTLLSSEFAKKNKQTKFFPVGNPSAPKTVPVFQYMHDLSVGFFSYRYIYMFFDLYKDIFGGQEDIFANHDNLLSLDCVLKTEELPNNVINLFDKNYIIVPTEEKKRWKKEPKRNYTKHKPYQHYYDEELIELVEFKDRLIIEKYNYEF